MPIKTKQRSHFFLPHSFLEAFIDVQRCHKSVSMQFYFKFRTGETHYLSVGFFVCLFLLFLFFKLMNSLRIKKKNHWLSVVDFRLTSFLVCCLCFSNSAACSSAVRKPAISLADSTDLRVLLNIMYMMVETIQQDDPADKPEWITIKETFRTELGKFHQSS